jgi:hypothetical protein
MTEPSTLKGGVGIGSKALPNRNNHVHGEHIRATAEFGLVARTRSGTAIINSRRVVEDSIATEACRFPHT